MGLLFKFGQAIPEIWGVLLAIVKGEIHTWNGTKNRIFYFFYFLFFFCSFLVINPHNFVKSHPIFNSNGLFFETFYRVLHDILFTLQKSSRWSLGSKN